MREKARRSTHRKVSISKTSGQISPCRSLKLQPTLENDRRTLKNICVPGCLGWRSDVPQFCASDSKLLNAAPHRGVARAKHADRTLWLLWRRRDADWVRGGPLIRPAVKGSTCTLTVLADAVQQRQMPQSGPHLGQSEHTDASLWDCAHAPNTTFSNSATRRALLQQILQHDAWQGATKTWQPRHSKFRSWTIAVA